LLDVSLRCDVRELALSIDLEVVERRAGLALEEEAPLGERLDLGQSRRARPDQMRGDVRLDLDAERLHPALRLLREVAQLPLVVDRRRVCGEDDAVAAAARALLR